MPFEQRSVTYFVCESCNQEYPIVDRLEYNKIYECSQDGCTNKETFLGLAPLQTFDFSAQADSKKKDVWLLKIVKIPFVQGILGSLLAAIILGAIFLLAVYQMRSDIKAEVIKEIKSEISSERGINNAH